VNRRFYGTVDLNPLPAKKQFAEIIDEVVQNFTTCPNDIVSIVVDIQLVAFELFKRNMTTGILNTIMDALAAQSTRSRHALASDKVRGGLKVVLLGSAMLYEAL